MMKTQISFWTLGLSSSALLATIASSWGAYMTSIKLNDTYARIETKLQEFLEDGKQTHSKAIHGSINLNTNVKTINIF